MWAKAKIDPIFIGAVIALFALNLIMVTSASIVIAEQKFGQPFYYTFHQSICILVGFIGAFFLYLIPLKHWFRLSAMMMILALILLVLVLIPGIGRVVNGSARWLNLGVSAFQVSEFCKLAVVVYLSGYIVRHGEALKEGLSGFVRPMLLLSLVGALLILEPDFGATVVILVTALAMLFLAGVPLWQFISL